MACAPAQRGFSLIEATIATGLMLAVTAVVFGLLHPAQGHLLRLSEAADMQQRLRVAADTLFRELVMAGDGADTGPNAGPLVYVLAPVRPGRRADPPGTFRTDAVTLMRRPAAEGEMSAHSYYLKTSDAAAGTYQLMRDDGAANDAPVVDNVVGLEFEYFGDREPPIMRRAPSDPTGPWTTYGPKPPPPASALPGWPPGENCVFTSDGSPLAGSRLPVLEAVGPATALVALVGALLADGPWCPDADHPDRFDADLLRIRKVGVRVRVQTGADVLRGPAGVLFTHAGTAAGAHRHLPDREVRFEVTPRNLNVAR
jgi:hypothetical protein